ncbi:MAG: TlpA family protein disulfide reductase [Oscillospiraceae bacterium]|nr:TlpA family protein disulfide reductase [Oscillospiraceae bacterium]
MKRMTGILMLCTLLLAGCGSKPMTAPTETTVLETTAAAGNTPAETTAENAAPTESADADDNTNPTAPTLENSFPPLQAFTAKTLDGTELTQDNLSLADVTVINIWSTTCPPCIAEMPEIAELTAALPDNVQFMTWCLDGQYEPETAKKILDDACFIGDTIVEWDGDLEKMLSYVMYTPTTIFVDSAGHQICEPIIGTAEDAKALYTDGINRALEALGLDPLELE